MAILYKFHDQCLSALLQFIIAVQKEEEMRQLAGTVEMAVKSC